MEIQVENLSYKREEKLILDNINIKAVSGCCMTILGESGSSKTTLLKALEGSLPVKGEVIYLKNKRKGPVTIGFLPTYLDSFFEKEWVGEEIEYRKNLYQKTEKDIENCLGLLNFSKQLFSHKIRNLKSSDQKILAFLCILLKDPDVLLLDEPTAGMSLSWQKKWIKILFTLKRKDKMVWIATNDSDFALSVSDYMYVIKDGNIKAEGTKYEVLKKTVFLKNVGLSVPKTIQFSKKVERYKKIKMGYRDDINDLIKDIFRYV